MAFRVVCRRYESGGRQERHGTLTLILPRFKDRIDLGRTAAPQPRFKSTTHQPVKSFWYGDGSTTDGSAIEGGDLRADDSFRHEPHLPCHGRPSKTDEEQYGGKADAECSVDWFHLCAHHKWKFRVIQRSINPGTPTAARPAYRWSQRGFSQ